MNIFQKVTLKNLKENRTRTLVTIVGIILSAAMFTAVTTSISSLMNFLIQTSIHEEGNWYGAAYNVSDEEITSLKKDSKITASVAMEGLGYASLTDTGNDYKPYLCVYGIDSDFTDMMPVRLTEGRMPQNSTELLLPDHLALFGDISYEIENELTLNLGIRKDFYGNRLTNHNPYNYNEDTKEITETLTTTNTRTYRIVGFYERPSFEDYSAPGFSALTVSDHAPDSLYDVYLRTASPNNMDAYMKSHFDGDFSLNYSLLRLYGASGESSYNQVLTGLASILIVIIMFGSISLIYNAFSISIGERTRQFGLLASIGATRRQLTGSVIFEAFFLSCIGIPLGLLSGLLGIGATFYLLGDKIVSVFAGNTPAFTLTLHPSAVSLLIAIAVSLVTILVSAFIPAKRAMKKSAIDSIRQSTDIVIRSGSVKTSALTNRLFGFEGMLASKNFKRNRRKYRATVVSLFLSVVLFISASSFGAYLTKSASSVLSDNGYDITYQHSSEQNYSVETLKSDLSGISSVTQVSYSTYLSLDGSIKTSALSRDYLDYQKKFAAASGLAYTEKEQTDIAIFINFVEDSSYRDFLAENNLDASAYFNKSNPTAVVMDTIKVYDNTDQKYYTFSMLENPSSDILNTFLLREQEGYYDNGYYYSDENGTVLQQFIGVNNSEEIIEIPRSESSFVLPLQIGATVSKAPFSVFQNDISINLLYPYSMMDDVFSNVESGVTYTNIPQFPLAEHSYINYFLKCSNHTQAVEDISHMLSQKNLPTDSLTDVAASLERDRGMVTVIQVFSYGFIVLISLIAAANVFNTISTNVNLRRREFAMLKSIGLTPQGFRKMMNFECLLYGFKGLLYGLPVSFLVTWLIYKSIASGLNLKFFIPWYSIVIAIGSVFAVVFATMLYSMSKLKHQNTIDELKNENL